MGTPAAQALNGNTTQPSGPGAAPPGSAPAPNAPAAGGGGSSQPPQGAAFFDSWLPANDASVKESREWLANKNFKDPAALVSAYRETERNTNALRQAAQLKGYPTDTKDAAGNVVKAKDSDVQAWRTSMGVPETADGYQLPVIEGNPYPEFTKHMANVLHEVGVPAAMAPLLFAGYEKAIQKMEASIRAQEDVASKEGVAQLEQSWGANYQERMNFAQRGMKWLESENGAAFSEHQMRAFETMLGTSKFMTMMWKLGAGNKEASFPGQDGGGAQKFQDGAEAAQAEYDQLQADRSAGKVSTEEYRKRERELSEIIASGFAKPN